MKNKLSLVILAVALTAFGCTKKVPYKYEFKEDVLDKSSIDTIDSTDQLLAAQGTNSPKDYLYTASVLEMSRQTVDGRPFSFGDSKRVQLKWTKDSLQILEKERDQRYNRDINDKVILDIPVDHVEYECVKDAYNNCTSAESAKTDITWSQKSKFKFKPEEAKQGALEFLPIMGDIALGDKCFSEVSSRLKGYEVTKEALNFQVERTYQQSPDCLNSIENSYTETSVKAVFNYSLVKANTITTPGFKAINYDTNEQVIFGFFGTDRKEHDVDNNITEKNRSTIMNHWNPDRSVIDYYLSDEFNKPNNAKIKAMTVEAVRRLNLGLAESGAKFQINLHDPEGKNPGDIRNSMIVLVEDPTENGLLGYGPQTEDPLTGEIISARTIMFLAGFQQGVQMNYEDLRRALKRQQAAQAGAQVAQTQTGSLSLSPDLIRTKDSLTHIKNSTYTVSKDIAAKSMLKSTLSKKLSKVSTKASAFKFNVNSAKKMMTTLRTNPDYMSGDIKSYSKYLKEAKNCYLDSSLMTNNLAEYRPDLTKTIVDKFSDGKGDLRPWKTLSTDEKQFLVDLIVPEEWIAVVLHEMGHNMGLRHNFKGSEDKNNFYNQQSPEQLEATLAASKLTDDQKAQIRADYAKDQAKLAQFKIDYTIPYSTIMEYGDDLKALPFLGKYDIAALRYGYARQVEVLDDAGAVTLKSLVQQNAPDLTAQGLKDAGVNLKKYGYCTDEFVGPNAGCRRFDEGTTLTEIAQNLAKTYHDFYYLRNFRNGKDNFSTVDDLTYYQTRYSRFMELRTFVETYERIKDTYSLADDDAIWNQVDWLKDLKQSTQVVSDLYLSVLQTPDLHCLIAKKDNPTQIIQILPLSQLGSFADSIDCFQIKDGDLSNDYVIAGQVGKRINSAKSPDNTSSYIDQIDVRGVWLDKLAVTRVIFKRTINASHDDFLDNLWDMNTVKSDLADTIGGIMVNRLKSTQVVTLRNGEQQPLTYYYDYSNEVSDVMMVPFFAKLIGLSVNTKHSMQDVIANASLIDATINPLRYDNGMEYKNFISVSLLKPTDAKPDLSSVLTAKVGSYTAVANPENIVASELLADYKVNDIFDGLLSSIFDKANQVGVSEAQAKSKFIIEKDDLVNLIVTKAKASKEDVVAIDKKELLAVAPEMSDAVAANLLEMNKQFGTKVLAERFVFFSNGLIQSNESIRSILTKMPLN